MFRGIDPAGLSALGDTVEQRAHSSRLSATNALNLLGRRGRVAEANTVGAAMGIVERWSLETAANLRWRADAIDTGQKAGLNVLSLLRAQFATEALFSIHEVDAAYDSWLRQIETSRQRVDTAVANISSWLHQGWTDLDVTNTDLHNIWTTLEDLTGDELDRVVAALSSAQLERWITEMGYRINGFSHGEKRDVFAMLAANASGATLGTLHDAILRVGGREEALDFGAAIQSITTDQAIVDFVAYAMSRDLTAPEFRALAPAVAIAGVTDDQALDAAVRAIVAREGALRSLVVDAFVADTTKEGEVSTSLLAALTRIADVGTRTAAFTTLTSLAAMPQHELTNLVAQRRSPQTRSEDTSSRRLAESVRTGALATATRLIEHDPNAVIQELATNSDPAGLVTTDYWDLLVGDGQGGTIKQILDQLRGGDLVSVAAFSTVGPDPDYPFPHARNLAFAAATLNLALGRQAERAKGDIDAIVRLSGVITSAVGLLSGVGDFAGAALGIGADSGISAYGAHSKDGMDEQLGSLIDQVTTTLRPPENGEPAADGAANAWTDVYLRLMPFA